MTITKWSVISLIIFSTSSNTVQYGVLFTIIKIYCANLRIHYSNIILAYNRLILVVLSWFCEPLLWMRKKVRKLTQPSSFKSEENTNTFNIHKNNLPLSNNCNVWVRSEIQLVWNTLENSLKSGFCEPLRKRKLACLGRFEKLGLKPSIIVYVSLNSV